APSPHQQRKRCMFPSLSSDKDSPMPPAMILPRLPILCDGKAGARMLSRAHRGAALGGRRGGSSVQEKGPGDGTPPAPWLRHSTRAASELAWFARAAERAGLINEGWARP